MPHALPPGPRAGTRHRTRFLAGLLLAVAVFAGACADDERTGIRVAPTSTVEAGVRAIVDNCPGPDAVTLSVREEVLWRIESIEPTPSEPAIGTPALREFLVGDTPDGWTVLQPLQTQLTGGVRYTITTQPDGLSLDFAVPDLSPGLLFNGEGNDQFNSRLMLEPCSEPADVGGFVRNIVILAALGLTASALVMVSIIMVLFVVTRRFSRIRAIQRRDAQRRRRVEEELAEAGAPDG